MAKSHYSPCFSQKRHLVPECLYLLQAWVLYVERLYGDVSVPVSAVDGPEGSLPDVLLVEEDVLGRDLPVLDGLLLLSARSRGAGAHVGVLDLLGG